MEQNKLELKKIIRETKEREHNLKICSLKMRERKEKKKTRKGV